jgi:hypothetical protein
MKHIVRHLERAGASAEEIAPYVAYNDIGEPCEDALTPDGDSCPRCGGPRAPSGVDGGSWVHFPQRRPGGDKPAAKPAAAYLTSSVDEIERLRAALRAARPCVFNSRHGSWEEALRLVDEALRGTDETKGGT